MCRPLHSARPPITAIRSQLFHISEAARDRVTAPAASEGGGWNGGSWSNLLHIDIDGHASSSADCFGSCSCGGLVLKVQSPEDWRQWYYDQLVPRVKFRLGPLRFKRVADRDRRGSFHDHPLRGPRRSPSTAGALALSFFDLSKRTLPLPTRRGVGLCRRQNPQAKERGNAHQRIAILS